MGSFRPVFWHRQSPEASPASLLLNFQYQLQFVSLVPFLSISLQGNSEVALLLLIQSINQNAGSLSQLNLLDFVFCVFLCMTQLWPFGKPKSCNFLIQSFFRVFMVNFFTAQIKMSNFHAVIFVKLRSGISIFFPCAIVSLTLNKT